MNTDNTKLRDKRITEEEAEKPTSKPNQRDTKYSQHFTPEAAQKNNESASSTPVPEAKKKRTKLQHDADTVGEKLDKARSKAGKSSQKQQSGGKFGQQIRMAGANAIHRKIGEAEHENAGTQSAHQAVYAGERLYGAARNAGRSAYRFARQSPIRKTAKLETKSLRANMRLDLHKVSNDPKLKSNALSRYMQKRRIKKQYAKAVRETRRGAQRAKKTADYTRKTTQMVVKLVSNPKVWILALIVLLIFALLSACSTFLSFMAGGTNQIAASSYLADEANITGAELLYTEWETDLQLRIDNAETDHTASDGSVGYSEYRRNVGNIGHDPFELMAYLTAMYQGFNVTAITPDLQTLFNSQYQISFVETVEAGKRIMTVTLVSHSLLDVVSMNEEQFTVYTLNMASYGNRQIFGNPIGFNWMNLVSSRFGYRVSPTDGTKEYHKGLDLSLPIGTNVLAVNGGTVSTANDPNGYGRYIIIENSEGLRSLYAHLDTILVSSGQTVNQGDVIARSGNSGSSTGPHLHLETSKNGQLLNPIYFIGG
jgi:murein DD-endopeptidase MepM/ murein hydrolase activator NlpD